MTTKHHHWIGGKPVEPESGSYLPTVNPSNRQPGPLIAAGSAADVERAIQAASAAQPSWARLSGAERSEVLHQVASAIEAGAEDLMELERQSTGKVDAQLHMEIDMCSAYFRYYAGVVRSLHGRTIDQGAHLHTYTRLEPYGVVAIITPWNFPINQACRGMAPALAAGNAVVGKPSEFTSPSTVHLARLATEAGLPDGLINIVTGTGLDVGAPLASHPLVRRIAFTGSVATGRHLAGVAAERLVPMTLELGGKSPVVVFADADLDRAIGAATSAMAMNAGQTCTATTRLLVEASIHDELTARVVDAAAKLQPGVDFGPMITETQFDKVLGHFATAAKAGVLPAVGGAGYTDGPAAEGMFIQPTVYTGVDPSLAIAREEVFGPVLVTMPFRDEAEALAMANDTEYGLFASVWSGDVSRGLRLAEQFQAGQVSVNGGALSIETPLGGYKNSGYGREKGLEALHDYAQVKCVSLAL
jgi:aldehyde dehydrogenase (NAD+)